MKANQNILYIILLVTAGLSSYANPNVWSGASNTGNFWNNWAFNVNGGYTSYFGDLSIYDSDLINKIKLESKPAYGVILTKYFNENIGISGQILFGGLKSKYNENLSFETDFIEYNVQLRVDLLNLIVRNNNSGLGIVAFGGIGHFIFNSVKYQFEEGKIKEYTHNTRTPEFVSFLGAGLKYTISDRISIHVDAALRQVQTDRIDNEVRQDNFDFYSYISVGVSYHIFRLFGKSRKGSLHRSGARMAYR